jgi:putative tricarboxylic transport membrane protein
MATDVQSIESDRNEEPLRADEKMAPAEKIKITMDKRIDLAILAVIVLLGIFLLITAQDIRVGKQPDPITSRGLPMIMGVFLIMGAVFLMVVRLKSWSSLPGHLIPNEGKEDEEGYPASWLRAFSIMAASMLWVWLLAPLGYLIVTLLFLMAFSLCLGERSWVKIIGFSTIYTLATWYIFSQPLKIQLPLGPLYNLFMSLGFAI